MVRSFRVIALLTLIILGRANDVYAELDYAIIKGADEVPILVAEGGNADGDVIVFVHGMSQSHLSWLPQFESDLAERYRLIAYDLRGHGGSGKPWEPTDYSASRKVWANDLHAVLKEKNVKSATLVAWSFGGYIAMSYLRAHGTEQGAIKINGLVLSGTLAGLIDLSKDKLPAPSQAVLEGSKQRGSLNLLENILGYSSMPDSFTFRPMSERFRQMSEASALMQPSYVRRSMTDLPLNNEDMVDRLTQPVLLSFGDQDRGLTPDAAARLAAELNNGILSEYADVGHFPSYEDSNRFNCELGEFVESKSVGPTCRTLNNKQENLSATPNLSACSDQPYCDFLRPEDISLIPDTDWAIVSDGNGLHLPLRLIKASQPSIKHEVVVDESSVFLDEKAGCGHASTTKGPLNVKAEGSLNKKAEGSQTKKAKDFRGHTVGIVNGEPTFAVIHIAAPSVIEIYEINQDSDVPSFVRKRCVPISEHLNLNDLALGVDGAVYASHMFSPPNSPKDIEKLMGLFRTKTSTGNAVVWREDTGWRSISGSELSFPNGIGVSDNNRVLAVSGTYSQSVKLIDLATSAVTSINLPIQPDNITTLENGRFMVVGHSGVPLTGIEACRPPEARPCGFPFMALEIGKTEVTKTLYKHDGQQYPGASVVVPWSDNKLLLGTAFGNRLTVVNRN